MNLKKVLEKMINGTVYTCNGTEFYFENYNFKWSDGLISGLIGSFKGYEDWEEIKEWYEKIPEKGLFCRVWDCDELEVSLRCIKSYSDEYFFDDHGATWLNAEPLTLDEVGVYIL